MSRKLIEHCVTFLDVLNEFGVQVRKAIKFCLVQVHHKELVGRRQICLLRCELTVKVWHVFAMFLMEEEQEIQMKKRPLAIYSTKQNSKAPKLL